MAGVIDGIPVRQQAPRGSTAKHAGTSKQGQTFKHNPRAFKRGPVQQGRRQNTVAGHAQHAKPRGLTPGDVACCTAEALAASLRLSGRPVSAGDVLGLYWHTAATPDAGASILAALKAAAEHGLAGVRPAWFGQETAVSCPVILGLQLPEGPHTVCAEPRGWWSWGDLRDFPDAVIEEAWGVAWPSPG